ncbi:Alpha/Beta hydrolase protein [Chytriomyces sp. MP71]|nr:Alpha/Beta hydrolase protein [Chytriomyces sp. MP71]
MAAPDEVIQYFAYDLVLSRHSQPAGATFPARLAYRTYGDPSQPVILMPTCFGGRLATTLPFLYKDTNAPFPPSQYYIVVVGLLGGSESSSPSNTPPPFNGPHFPCVTYEDNMRLQHALCMHLGVSCLHAYIGFSMGGQLAYHMASLYPAFVHRAVCIAGSAKTSAHNWCFLEGPKAALVSSADFSGGLYGPAGARVGTRAFARVYSVWALSPEWFNKKCWEARGFASLEAYLAIAWEEKGLGAWDANDLLCLLDTWQKGDIGLYFPEDIGDLGQTLSRIEARVLVMPSLTDAYFPPEDNLEEVKHLKMGKFVAIDSIWGHLAGGGGGTEADTRFIIEQVGAWVKDSDGSQKL